VKQRWGKLENLSGIHRGLAPVLDQPWPTPPPRSNQRLNRRGRIGCRTLNQRVVGRGEGTAWYLWAGYLKSTARGSHISRNAWGTPNLSKEETKLLCSPWLGELFCPHKTLKDLCVTWFVNFTWPLDVTCVFGLHSFWKFYCLFIKKPDQLFVFSALLFPRRLNAVFLIRTDYWILYQIVE
jgi:hypothetical protein